MSATDLQELVKHRQLRLEEHLRMLHTYHRLKESIEVQKKVLKQCVFVLQTVQKKIE